MISKNATNAAAASQNCFANCFANDLANVHNQSPIVDKFVRAQSVFAYEGYRPEYKKQFKKQYKETYKNYNTKLIGFPRPTTTAFPQSTRIQNSIFANSLNHMSSAVGTLWNSATSIINPKLPATGTLDVPKLLHYVWLGKNISEQNLYNILLATHINPSYQTTIWTDRLMSIYSTLDKMINSDITTHRKLARKYAKKIDVRPTQEIFKELKTAYTDAHKIESLFECEKHAASPYKNYAAASDIARLAILYNKGGVYMDVDIMLGKPLSEIKVPFGFRIFVPCESASASISSNAVLVARPKEKLVAQMIINIKDNYEKLSEKTLQEKRTLYEESNDNCRKLTIDLTGPGLISKTLSFISYYNDIYPFLSIRDQIDANMDINTFGSYKPAEKSNIEQACNQLNEYPKTVEEIYFANFDQSIDGDGEWLDQFKSAVKEMKKTGKSIEV